MAKLVKNYYYRKNEKKLNGYLVGISKKLVQQANIDDSKEIKVYVKENKIIIEEERN